MVRYSTLPKVEAGTSKVPEAGAEYEDEVREVSKTDQLPRAKGLGIEIFSYQKMNRRNTL